MKNNYPRPSTGALVPPEVLESRRAKATIERELIFGCMSSFVFYRQIRDTICPWDPERSMHRQDFSVEKYNVLFRAIDSFYRRFDNKPIITTMYLPNRVLAATLVDWANKNSVPVSVVEELLAELTEETEFTQSLTLESLTALTQGAAFSDWLKSRLVVQAMGKLQSQIGLGKLTMESMIDEMKNCQKAVRSLDTEIVLPPPQPAVNLDPGEFPFDAQNPVMRTIAEETAAVYQIPESITALTTIATLSGAMGRGWVIAGAVNGYETPGNLYIVIAAPKSFGKGAATTLVKPLIEASEIVSRKFQEQTLPGLNAELFQVEQQIRNLEKKTTPAEKDVESLTTLLQRKGELEAAMKTTPTLWIGSATGAALANCLFANKETIFSFSGEAGDMVRIAMGKFNKDRSGDFDMFLSGYSNEWMGESRVGRGTLRMRPCIAVLWFCQPVIFEEMLTNQEALQRGLTARIIGHVVNQDVVPEDDGILRSIKPETKSAWEGLINKVLELRENHESPQVIQCSPEAREVFREFHNAIVALRNGSFKDVADELGRARENVIRVAVGIWVADMVTGQCTPDSPLSADQAERAVRLVRWAQLSMLQYLSKQLAKKRLDEVTNLISKIEKFGMEVTLADLENRHGIRRDKVLSLAGEFHELIRVVKRTRTTGRPSDVLQILK